MQRYFTYDKKGVKREVTKSQMKQLIDAGKKTINDFTKEVSEPKPKPTPESKKLKEFSTKSKENALTESKKLPNVIAKSREAAMVGDDTWYERYLENNEDINTPIESKSTPKNIAMGLFEYLAPESYEETMKGEQGVSLTNVKELAPAVVGLGAGAGAGKLASKFIPQVASKFAAYPIAAGSGMAQGAAVKGAEDLTRMAAGGESPSLSEYIVPTLLGGAGEGVATGLKRFAAKKVPQVIEDIPIFKDYYYPSEAPGPQNIPGLNLEQLPALAFKKDGNKVLANLKKQSEDLAKELSNVEKYEKELIKQKASTELLKSARTKKESIRRELKNRDIRIRKFDESPENALAEARQYQIDRAVDELKIESKSKSAWTMKNATPETSNMISDAAKKAEPSVAGLRGTNIGDIPLYEGKLNFPIVGKPKISTDYRNLYRMQESGNLYNDRYFEPFRSKYKPSITLADYLMEPMYED